MRVSESQPNRQLPNRFNQPGIDSIGLLSWYVHAMRRYWLARSHLPMLATFATNGPRLRSFRLMSWLLYHCSCLPFRVQLFPRI